MAALHQPKVTYSEYEQMLVDRAVEAVIVATTDAFHVPLSKQALGAEKHVFVEKPLGVTVEECEDLARLARDSSRVFQIGFNRRFEPSLAFAKSFVEVEVGTLSQFNSWYCDSIARYTMTDNLQPIPILSAERKRPAVDPKSDKQRYFLATHGSHLFDTTRFLAGSISAVQARHKDRSGSHVWSIEVEFESACLGHLTLIVPAAADFEEGIQLFGEGGSVQGRLHLPWYRKAGSLECFSARDGVYRRPLGADADTYKLQLESFADAILAGTQPKGASACDGVANLRALVAVSRSCESGGWVRLADVSGGI
jgi:predicted dehydrogenase